MLTLRLLDDRNRPVPVSPRDSQRRFQLEHDLQTAWKAGRVPDYATIQRRFAWAMLRCFLLIAICWAAWTFTLMWLLPGLLGRTALSGERSMHALFSSWFNAGGGHASLATVTYIVYNFVGFMGPLLTSFWFWHRFVAQADARRTLLMRVCAGCVYSLHDIQPAADGCTVCPECGAAWRVPGGAIRMEHVPAN